MSLEFPAGDTPVGGGFIATPTMADINVLQTQIDELRKAVEFLMRHTHYSDAHLGGSGRTSGPEDKR